MEVNFSGFPVGETDGRGHYSAQCYGHLFGGLGGIGNNEVIRIGLGSRITSKYIKALFLLKTLPL